MVATKRAGLLAMAITGGLILSGPGASAQALRLGLAQPAATRAVVAPEGVAYRGGGVRVGGGGMRAMGAPRMGGPRMVAPRYSGGRYVGRPMGRPIAGPVARPVGPRMAYGPGFRPGPAHGWGPGPGRPPGWGPGPGRPPGGWHPPPPGWGRPGWRPPPGAWGPGPWRPGWGWWRPGWGWGYYDNTGAWIALGVASGLALGAVAATADNTVTYDDAVAYCMQRFRSYNPATGTYTGYDGFQHPCP